jgi:RsiW-degrading membrane proteinase PrsW (M82 family)
LGESFEPRIGDKAYGVADAFFLAIVVELRHCEARIRPYLEGVIGEGAKLILPLVFYFLGRYRSEAAGIVLGVATAMGFAALETMGYGLTSFLLSKGSLGVLDEVLLVRGLMSPAGHAAWTGLVCAVLWRERLKAGHPTFNWRVGGAFATAVILHALWDTFASVKTSTFAGFLGIQVVSLLIALVSLTLLIRRVREARRATIEGGGRVA